MTCRSFGHRAPLLWLLAPMIAGLAAGRALPALPVAAFLALAFLGSAVALACCVRRVRFAGWAASLVLAVFCASLASYTLHRRRVERWAAYPSREVLVEVRIDRMFASSDPRKSSGLGLIRASPRAELIDQTVYFSLGLRRNERAPARGSVVRLRALMSPVPANPGAATFDGYLAAAGINFKLLRGRAQAVVVPQGPYHAFCDAAAARFRAILDRGIDAKRPDLAALLRGMMLGQTSDLSEDQRTVFRQSGTMHLFAISGLNIGVIAVALEALLLLTRLPLAARFVLGLALLWLFVDITGASPSAVRAFGMAAFVHLARLCRRPNTPLAAIVGSATFVVAMAPFQLFSASFIMSYGIVIAILTLGAPLAEHCLAWWSPWHLVPRVTWARWQEWTVWVWRWLVQSVAVGIAAAVVGTLTGILFFELVTPASLAANLALIPAAVAATTGGFVSLLCGLLGFEAGSIHCNHAAALVLWGIEALARWSLTWPGAFFDAFFQPGWIGPAALLAMMVVLLAGYAARWERKVGGWAAPFVLLAVTLTAGVTYGVGG